MPSAVPTKELTITRLGNTSFPDLYHKLITNSDLSDLDILKLLSIAVLLINQSEKSLQQLGYRVILAYGNRYNDYKPLYEITSNIGLTPVAALIRRILEEDGDANKDSFISTITDSYAEVFEEGGIYKTEQQYLLEKFFENRIFDSVSVVAPTSYGKSELMISSLRNTKGKKTCILVPTKSLLSQTKKRILDADIDWVNHIVSHPEMHFEGGENYVYVLTQERLSRLLNQDEKLVFDILFVDEAHNLLDDDSRNYTLATVICILKHRNPNTAVKYLTPFLKDAENLRMRFVRYESAGYSIDEYIKSERFYICDFRQSGPSIKLYDQFTGSFIDQGRSDAGSELEYITANSVSKNIVYFNKPKAIEEFAVRLSEALDDLVDETVVRAVKEIGAGIDKRYKLIRCLRKGVVYHHGSMPDAIRNYVEYLYRTCDDIKYLISNSTLLEGVNLPIERLFMLDYAKGPSKLSPAQFKNLVGRVSRFSEVFRRADRSSLKKLEPQIHIVGSDSYIRADANLENFINDCMSVKKEVVDKPLNTLLSNTEITSENRDALLSSTSRLENLENGIVENYKSEYVETSVGKLLIANSISEIDAFQNEIFIQTILDQYEKYSISSANKLIEVICKAFVPYVEDTRDNAKLRRVINEPAQMFYSMLLDWNIENVPFPKMIALMLKHWEKQLEKQYYDGIVYVGKWGDRRRGDGHRNDYVDMRRKTISERVNLAIVRIKEEEDFLEHKLFRFIDVLESLELIDFTFFKQIKYGTTDDEKICLIKYGFSLGLAEKVLRDYRDFVNISQHGIVTVIPELIPAMDGAEESKLLVLEAELNTKRPNKGSKRNRL